MKTIAPYLRVIAGFFAAVCTWVTIPELIKGEFGGAVTLLLMAAGLWYLALGKPIRDHRARLKDEQDAIAARADAGHAAFLAGDPLAFAPPPAKARPQPMRKGVVVAAAIAGGLFLIGVVSDLTDGGERGESPATASDQPTAEPATPAAAAPTESEEGAAAVMPNVLCMTLQDAQDKIQQNGVFWSDSEDATGAGRQQVLDSNWVVLHQSPAAGAQVEDSEAMLSVVKKGEPGDCS